MGSPIYPNSTPPVTEGRSMPPVTEGRDRLPPEGGMSRKIDVPDPQRLMPPAPPGESYYRPPQLQTPIPVEKPATNDPKPPPSVRLDRIVMLDEPNVEGQVVKSGTDPQPGARVVFVSQDQLGAQQTVTADEKGNFKVSLASGGWLVYVHDEKGNPVLKEKVEVKENQPHRMILTSR
jgi:hypothetical protein